MTASWRFLKAPRFWAVAYFAVGLLAAGSGLGRSPDHCRGGWPPSFPALSGTPPAEANAVTVLFWPAVLLAVSKSGCQSAAPPSSSPAPSTLPPTSFGGPKPRAGSSAMARECFRDSVCHQSVCTEVPLRRVEQQKLNHYIFQLARFNIGWNAGFKRIHGVSPQDISDGVDVTIAK
jgi:hypothetical protein